MIEYIARLPRVQLGCYPTPLVEAVRLSEVLHGPRILIKRDDLSGLALGGNKCRKLEFLIGYARQKKYDSFIIAGISNLSVQLASACARLNMPFKLVLIGETAEKQGNYVLIRILGSDTEMYEPVQTGNMEVIIASRNTALENEAIKLRQEGKNPFIMRSYESTPMENTGWVNAADELQQQLRETGINANYLVIATGQGGSHAGLEVGVRLLGNPLKVAGISTFWKKEKATEEVARIASETAGYLKLDMKIVPEEITVYDEYLGEGYGNITRDSSEAIKLVARTEGIFLDPVYTGKAMSGLIDLIRNGRFTSKDTIVFVHTGGAPIIFSCASEIIK